MCAVTSLPCSSVTPLDRSTIQAAYEREASTGSTSHENGLRVIDADCDNPVAGKSLCQVTLVSDDDPEQHLYYDVVAVAWIDGGWVLISGLCKR